MLSCPGEKRAPLYQFPFVYGDLAALIRIQSSEEVVTKEFGPIRAIGPDPISKVRDGIY